MSNQNDDGLVNACQVLRDDLAVDMMREDFGRCPSPNAPSILLQIAEIAATQAHTWAGLRAKASIFSIVENEELAASIAEDINGMPA